MTDREVLIAARLLIARPERWTHGASARYADGLSCGPQSPHAVCWCATGALIRVTPPFGSGLLWGALRMLREVVVMEPALYNDTHTHAEVLIMYDRAIEATA